MDFTRNALAQLQSWIGSKASCHPFYSTCSPATLCALGPPPF